MTPTLHVFGGHRGAFSALSPLEALGHRPTVTVVDPVVGRAQRLIERLGLRGRAVEARAEESLQGLEPTALVLAGTDDMATNRRVFREVGRRQVTALQQVIRSASSDRALPGIVTGLVAVQGPGRPDPIMDQVFRDLSGLRRTSSAAFEDDRVSERKLVPTRREIGQATASLLVAPKRALEAVTPHLLVYRSVRYALLAVEGEIGHLARDIGETMAGARALASAAVLVRDPEGIDLVVVRCGFARARFPIFRRRPPEYAGSLSVDTLTTD